jgi:hypothetical protein
MSKTATTYTVLDANDTVVKTGIAKKANAVTAANEGRSATRKTHRVVTNNGTEVYVVKGVRGMKIVPAYSRTVDLPEGFEIPEGTRPAYLRKRHDALILAEGEGRETTYSVIRLSTGEVADEAFDTTREAGKFVLTF